MIYATLRQIQAAVSPWISHCATGHLKSFEHANRSVSLRVDDVPIISPTTGEQDLRIIRRKSKMPATLAHWNFSHELQCVSIINLEHLRLRRSHQEPPALSIVGHSVATRGSWWLRRRRRDRKSTRL